MIIISQPFVDRSKWPKGPWDDEPDKMNWTTKAGLPGMIVRSEIMGNLCGYAAVPSSHPWHGLTFRDAKILMRISVHGGLTYSAPCEGRICHKAVADEEDDVWWFGFDCCHGMDLAPMMVGMFKDMPFSLSSIGKYRDVAYVYGEVEDLAKQLVAIDKGGNHDGED